MLLTNFWVSNVFTNVGLHYRDANACSRNDPARW